MIFLQIVYIHQNKGIWGNYKSWARSHFPVGNPAAKYFNTCFNAAHRFFKHLSIKSESNKSKSSIIKHFFTYRQVENEKICCVPHVLVQQDYEDYKKVANKPKNNDEGEEYWNQKRNNFH